jgi:hypothetical protein
MLRDTHYICADSILVTKHMGGVFTVIGSTYSVYDYGNTSRLMDLAQSRRGGFVYTFIILVEVICYQNWRGLHS